MTDEQYEPAPESEAPDAGEQHDDTTGRENWSLARWLGETVLLLGLAFLLATGIKTFVVQPFVIPTGSMQPTVEINDRVFYNKFIYRFEDPESGDIVVFDNPDDPGGTPLTKRVIAVGGQTVEILDGYVYVDGVQIDEPYIDPARRDDRTLGGPIEIPEGYVWLMGDNRAHSGDSRIFGPQPADNVQGKAFVIYWPLDRLGTL